MVTAPARARRDSSSARIASGSGQPKRPISGSVMATTAIFGGVADGVAKARTSAS